MMNEMNTLLFRLLNQQATGVDNDTLHQSQTSPVENENCESVVTLDIETICESKLTSETMNENENPDEINDNGLYISEIVLSESQCEEELNVEEDAHEDAHEENNTTEYNCDIETTDDYQDIRSEPVSLIVSELLENAL